MRTNYARINKNKLVRIVADYGVLHLVKRIYNRILLQPLIYLFAPVSFQVGKRYYLYFKHSYNTTFINERAVEIPLFLELLNTHENCQVLEIGNVLSHYVKPHWDIVDKFEIAPDVKNIDVLDYHPEKRLNLIFAISTFEHIGFDENPKDPKKILQVIEHLRKNCLVEGGKIVFSIPLAWNRELENMLVNKTINYKKITFFERTSFLNIWKEVTPTEEWFKKPYSLICNGMMFVEL